jgi:hypothetical protein
VPVLASLTDAEYLSIPCCAWDFDERYQMRKRTAKREKGGDDEGEGRSKEEEELETKLKFGEVDGRLGLYACECLITAPRSDEDGGKMLFLLFTC